MQRQDVAANRLAPALEGHLGELPVGQVRRRLIQAAQTGDVGDGFDVECQDRSHGEAGARQRKKI
jgi:hypothetical protein